ncbi:MAG: hypothetical protein NC200_04370 [Candidatus Gastranaerophilales bacterium]|nr:hypothetical protein [Candidatus Gastranaerophilales bacterium]
MAIKPINPSDETSKFKTKLSVAAGAGIVAGTGYFSSKKNWLYKDAPSDTFVKQVSNNLKKDMSSEELKESSKINKFLKDVVNPEVELENLKPQIRDSKELSDAIKATPEEPIEDAITRVFSKPSKEEVKQELMNLQYKTKSDKKCSENTALKLIHDNFDAKNKKLFKSETTPEATFKMLKNTAKKIQTKAAVVGGLAGGLIAGALCLVAIDVPGSNKK